MNFDLQERKILVEEYQQLRATTGWYMLPDELVNKALQNDLFSICIYDQDQLIGMGRVIGDNALYYYIQDVVVTPEYQGKGVGKLIMTAIEQYLDSQAAHHAFIALMSAEGVAGFYKSFGYGERAPGKPGMFKYILRED